MTFRVYMFSIAEVNILNVDTVVFQIESRVLTIE